MYTTSATASTAAMPTKEFPYNLTKYEYLAAEVLPCPGAHYKVG